MSKHLTYIIKFIPDLTCCSDRDQLDALLTRKRVGAYVGIDPTAESLHVGHLVPIMALYWMHVHGFFAVTLVYRITFDCERKAD